MAQGRLILAAPALLVALVVTCDAAFAEPASPSTSPAVRAPPFAVPETPIPARPTPLLPAVRFVPGSLLLPPPGPRPVLRDTCGAGALAWLVGQPRSRIPIPVDLSRRRVSCTACVVAPDVRLDRLDILYDARTNLVTRVTCG